MKIKYWLIISYFVVIILPLIALYFLYININYFDEKQDVKEFIEASSLVKELEPYLTEPGFYQIQSSDHYDTIANLANDSLKITLYRSDGTTLYSTLEDINSQRLIQVNRMHLYKNLNELQKNARTYSIKKAVFDNQELVGIFEITIGREDWVEGVNNRTFIAGIILVGFIIALYIVVIVLLHRKLNRPLKLLQSEMTAFAQGKQVKDDIYQANDEIGELIKHFYHMKTQIEETRKALVNQQQEKHYIIAALSHDLKTPLTVIQAYAEALITGKDLSNQEKGEYSSILFNKLDYMKQLLDDLTIFTKLESNHEPTEFVEVDGEEFFDMLLSGYDEPCAKQSVILKTEACIKQNYQVNVGQLTRVVDNLMANSIRHTETGKMIGLAAIASDCRLPEWVFAPFHDSLQTFRNEGTIIIIQNEGRAIPADQQKRIFLPFVQVEDARASGGSSGLGLSIAKRLIENHGGDIMLWSRDGYGTLVAFRIKER
ncbi:sensor histidine kinase [Aquibacillus rhizosphaerae]|uniref:histidine kinase n=1 Tax=Aquibacillus rhizosphaerae TaxID=3051431 RepID=A0ABT7LB58_9BACI|nr:HAMP domain-containing sensor histidine kinase [Aquibacillus sp. LR5S19]MDL4843106.1 HAMP domain-containing sensor histidine kinase [Aquibacillus sp. LR5S19]